MTRRRHHRLPAIIYTLDVNIKSNIPDTSTHRSADRPARHIHDRGMVKCPLRPYTATPRRNMRHDTRTYTLRSSYMSWTPSFAHREYPLKYDTNFSQPVRDLSRHLHTHPFMRRDTCTYAPTHNGHLPTYTAGLRLSTTLTCHV
jgi:hypothetical protein